MYSVLSVQLLDLFGKEVILCTFTVLITYKHRIASNVHNNSLRHQPKHEPAVIREAFIKSILMVCLHRAKFGCSYIIHILSQGKNNNLIPKLVSWIITQVYNLNYL